MTDAYLCRVVAPVARNLVLNPSLETGTAGWAGSRAVARVTGSGQAFGNFYGRVTAVTGDAGLVAYVETAVTAGATYYARMSTRTNVTSRWMDLALVWFDASNAVVGTAVLGTSLPVSAAWQTLSASAAAPATTVKVRVQVTLRQTAGAGGANYLPITGQRLDVDGASVSTTPGTDYFDGSSNDWAWTGTPHASASGPAVAEVVDVDVVQTFGGSRDARTVTHAIPAGGNVYTVRPHGPRSGTFSFGFRGETSATRAGAAERALGDGGVFLLRDAPLDVSQFRATSGTLPAMRWRVTGQLTFERVPEVRGQAWLVGADWTEA